MDYNWKRERPFGPHRHQPPNVRSHRAKENYHHIIHYPEEYTIKKLDGKPSYENALNSFFGGLKRFIHLRCFCCISTPYLLVTKLGGRHPVTGRKVIEAVGGGSKQKARWIDWLRFELLLRVQKN